MSITLIIARHGNTFSDGQTPTRVGARTDLPLVESGESQALRLGHYLKDNALIPDLIFTSSLRRTIDTARLACVAMSCSAPSSPLSFLNEIDYGPDENQPEDAVKARIGEQAIIDWDKNCIMPADWSPRPEAILAEWQNFLKTCAEQRQGKTVMVVTSNGIARFVLALTQCGKDYPPKLATGALGIVKFGTDWAVTDWNIRP